MEREPVPPEQSARIALDVQPGGGTTPVPRTEGVEASAGAQDAAFFPNQVVAERFKIVRFIGRGGMGEVYEAEDLELHERVALKTVRPSAAQDSRAVERFKREINLARKVTHANVCRTFDLYHHCPDPESSSGKIAFLSMEFLPGETVAQRIRRAGRMTVSQALPIVLQMAGALAEAERANIVHRDFKSQNVILVEPADSSGSMRAVVTDFGLARLGVGSGTETGQSSLGDFAGSPAYMAPEQVEGEEVTAATDVYALGVVMYEMMTGVLPFVGDSPLETAVKRLKESPPSPRSLAPDLDARWERVILHCLERDPARRFLSSAEVARALGGETPPTLFSLVNRRWLITGGSVAAMVMLAATFVYLKVGRRPSRVAPPTQESAIPASPPASKAVSTASPAKAPARSPSAAAKSKPAGSAPSIADAAANALWKQGDLEGARRAYQTALDAERAHGTTDAVAGTLASLGVVLGEQSNLTAARSTLEQALELYRQTRDPAGLARALVGLGRVLADAGDFAAARKNYDESLAIAGGAGDKTAVARALTAEASLLLATGDATGARSKSEEAVKLLGQANDTSGLARAERQLGLVLLAQGELDPARSHLERSLELSRQLGEKPSVGESQLAMAQIAVEDGRASEAQKEAQAAVEEFRREKASDDVVLATAVLARAWLAQGRLQDALRVIEEVRGPAQQSEAVRVPLMVSALGAVAQVAGSAAASSKGADAGLQAGVEASSESLKSVIAESKRRGLVNVELEARLALGEMDMKYGNPRSGRTRLAAVEKQASARGFRLIARQVESARKLRAGG
ncbi:MAG TPA: protein kinase [Terriglobia bacterium]|nr:protein kinase [Terriglobia bacterium]